MNKLYHLLYLLVVLTTQGQSQITTRDYNTTTQNQKTKLKTPKVLRPYLEDLVLIPGGTFIMGQALGDQKVYTTPNDSNLLISQQPRRVTVSGFYISHKEVTNLEWREFYEAKRAELGAAKAAQYLPDTLVWQKEFPHSLSTLMVQNYYWHPAYENYPVVGVSWEQAQAFCEWKSAYVNAALAEYGIEPLPNFRLPTEAEWEFAARGMLLDNTVNLIHPAQNDLNMGAVYDQNGIQLIDYIDDGSLYTTPVGNYAPNDYGLYDMAGNVSEWVQDAAWLPNGIKLEENITKDTILSRLIRRDEAKKTEDILAKVQYEELANKILRDWIIIEKYSAENGKPQIVKGGAWCDPTIYQYAASRQLWEQKKGSSRIGFRLAMTKLGTSDPRLGLGNGWGARQKALLPKGHVFNLKKKTSKAKW